MNTTREQIRQAAAGSVPKPTAEPKVPAPAPEQNGGASTKPAEAKAPKAAKTAQPCKCGVPDAPGTNGGCADGKTKGVFAPGHDAKLVGWLTREVVAGNMTAENAVADLAGKGGSQLLQGKLKAAIARETDKATKRKANETAKAEAKAAKEGALAEARAQAEKAKEELAAKRES